MQITNFSISPDRKKLSIEVASTYGISSFYLWDNNTYKDYSKAINLMDRVTGNSYEFLEIEAIELGLKYFSGVYFLEITDSSDISYAITSELTRYKECIMNEVLKHSICDECLKEKTISLINSQGLLRGLMDAIDLGFIDEILIIIKALDKFCKDDCKTCGDYSNIINNSYYSTNNYD